MEFTDEIHDETPQRQRDIDGCIYHYIEKEWTHSLVDYLAIA